MPSWYWSAAEEYPETTLLPNSFSIPLRGLPACPPSKIAAPTLLNVDPEEPGGLYTWCAGTSTVYLSFPFIKL